MLVWVGTADPRGGSDLEFVRDLHIARRGKDAQPRALQQESRIHQLAHGLQIEETEKHGGEDFDFVSETHAQRERKDNREHGSSAWVHDGGVSVKTHTQDRIAALRDHAQTCSYLAKLRPGHRDTPAPNGK